MSSLLEVLTPRTRGDFIGNQLALSKCLRWCKNLTREKVLCISGPTGVGKTTLVNIISDILKRRILEYSTQDIQSIYSMAKKRSLDDEKLGLILIDSTDTSIISKGWRTFISKTAFLEVPIILVVNVLDYKHTAFIQDQCIHAQLSTCSTSDTMEIIRRVNTITKVKFKKTEIEQISRASAGDFRQIIYNCELHSRGGHGTKFELRDLDLPYNQFTAATLGWKPQPGSALSCMMKSITSRIIFMESLVSTDPSRAMAIVHEGYISLTGDNVNSLADISDYISTIDIMRNNIEVYALVGGLSSLWRHSPSAQKKPTIRMALFSHQKEVNSFTKNIKKKHNNIISYLDERVFLDNKERMICRF